MVRCEWLDAPTVDVAEIGVTRGELFVEFAVDFADAALPLSPLQLQPPRGLHRWPSRSVFGPLPGLLDDSMPDAWGQKVMDRSLRGQGIARPTILQRLAWLGSATMGALTYHPTSRDDAGPVDVDLAETAAAAVEIVSGNPAEVLDAIAHAGGSPGGTRPKVVVGLTDDDTLITGEGALPDGYEPWLVKFAAPDDLGASGPVEHAYLAMARGAGLATVDARLLTDAAGRRHVAVRRFDRVGAGRQTARRHTSTVSGILHADHRLPSTDYESILRLTRRLTADQHAVEQTFRLAVFNVVAHNRDDHTKNVSYVLGLDGIWTLAPAYDLTWSAGAGGEHATAVAGKGRDVTRDDLLALARPAGLSVRAAGEVIDTVCDAVGGWPGFAHASGVDEMTARQVAADHQQL